MHGAVLLENTRLFYSLRRSEKDYRTMVERAHLGMALLDDDGQIRQTNGPMRELLGEHGKLWLLCRLRGERGPSASGEVLLSGGGNSDLLTKVTLIGADGARRVRLSVTPLRERMDRRGGHLLIARDITEEVAIANEREAMARRVQQAEKLSAVGQFVAGIAHEQQPSDGRHRVHRTAGWRARPEPTPRGRLNKSYSTHNAVGASWQICSPFHDRSRGAPSRSSWQTWFTSLSGNSSQSSTWRHGRDQRHADVPPVFGSPHALCQLVTNIIANALDAVALQETPGKVTVTLQQHKGEQHLNIRDNGLGSPRQTESSTPSIRPNRSEKGPALG